jgi:hypothetical protein
MASASNRAVNPRLGLSPSDPSFPDAVGGTAQAGDPGMHQDPVLTGVQVAPYALAVVVDGGRGQALATDPQCVLRQRDPDVHLPVGQTQVDLLDTPRLLKAQNRGRQALVVPPRLLPRAVARWEGTTVVGRESKSAHAAATRRPEEPKM